MLQRIPTQVALADLVQPSLDVIAPNKRTIEAELMDWADDVTYPVHDLEDFYRAGRLPLHSLLQRDARERRYFFENALERNKDNKKFPPAKDLEEIFMGALLPTFSITRAYDGSSTQRAALRHFTGILIGRYINAVTLVEDNSHVRAVIEPNLRAEVTMLKELIWTYVIEAPSLAARSHGQKRIIQDLFSIYTDLASQSKAWQAFPTFYRERLKEADGKPEAVIRTCVDLIASMTESQAIAMHRRLMGQDHTAGLDDILQ